MIEVLLRAGGLLAIYLLVLTSVSPGDVLVGALLALGLTVAGRSRRSWSRHSPWVRWAPAFAGVLLTTARDMVVGSWHAVRFCLGSPAQPGFVEIPGDGRSPVAVALWGVLTGEAPDEYPVDVDAERGALIVHVLDSRDPDAIRARHARSRDRWQRHVVD